MPWDQNKASETDGQEADPMMSPKDAILALTSVTVLSTTAVSDSPLPMPWAISLYKAIAQIQINGILKYFSVEGLLKSISNVGLYNSNRN